MGDPPESLPGIPKVVKKKKQKRREAIGARSIPKRGTATKGRVEIRSSIQWEGKTATGKRKVVSEPKK